MDNTRTESSVCWSTDFKAIGMIMSIIPRVIRNLLFCFFVCFIISYYLCKIRVYLWNNVYRFAFFCIFLLARQLIFSINSTNASLGTLTPIDWGTIETKDLRAPPNGARNLVLVRKTKNYSLFVDGVIPYTSESECSRTPKTSACPTNCPDSERGANGSVISRRRRGLLCLNGTNSTQYLTFTCSVPCPSYKPASPRIIWLNNGSVV